MANKSKVQSVEPDIADLVNGWLKSYGLDYKLEQASLNSEIDKALDEYHSKSGGKGGNRPDAKLLLKDKYGTFYPVLIEYKGYKDKLVKLDTDGIVDNKKDKNEPNYTNIKSYAVNGAIHYANAILHYTSYTRIIAIGVTGYKDEFGKLQHEIGVYYVSADKNNLGFGQRVGDYTDLSFLKPSHFDEFVEKLNELSLTQAEIDKLKEKREKEAARGLKPKPIRALVAGIPNVGKSTFINKIAKRKAAAVGNKPGVTRQKQWIRIGNQIELLDTPGVLWPKFESEEVGLNLAYTGSIKEEILEKTEIAYNLLKFLDENYSSDLYAKYKISEQEIDEIKDNPQYTLELMYLIGKKRGALISGGNIDEEKVAKIILDDFKNGRIGKITLEKAE